MHTHIIFMIDASRGFMKDGPKNRLREMDLHRIVDVFRRGADAPKYARMVGYDEIEKNDFNLNLPRYIDSQPLEDRQDIEGHLKGGIPRRDVEALAPHWAVCPSLKAALFRPNRPGYLDLAVKPEAIRAAIHDHPEFCAFTQGLTEHFAAWRKSETERLKGLAPGFHPKARIAELAEGLLDHYGRRSLIDPYDVYQHLMDYWAETMQDDAYLIADGGWKVETYRVIERKKDKNGKETVKDKGWACDLVPKELIVARYFAREAAKIGGLEAEQDRVAAELAALEEEHGSEDGLFSELIEDGEVVVTVAGVKARLKEIKGDRSAAEEAKALKIWLDLSEQEKELRRAIRDADEALDEAALKTYPKLTDAELKTLVVDDKWMANLEARVAGETARVARALTRRVKELGDRYGATMASLADRATDLEKAVAGHLAKMGYV
jgi:type I restriction enzyme M protein